MIIGLKTHGRQRFTFAFEKLAGAIWPRDSNIRNIFLKNVEVLQHFVCV